jgi:hypothetical protein
MQEWKAPSTFHYTILFLTGLGMRPLIWCNIPIISSRYFVYIMYLQLAFTKKHIVSINVMRTNICYAIHFNVSRWGKSPSWLKSMYYKVLLLFVHNVHFMSIITVLSEPYKCQENWNFLPMTLEWHHSLF